MSFRATLKKLIRRDATATSLRERSTTLRASISLCPLEPQAQPTPGSPEAMAAWQAACHEHSIRTVPLQNCPELMRTEQDVWSTKSLMHAMAAGEISVAEYARLHPIASDRELRFAEIAHELNIGGLFALAYADEYPVKSPENGGRTATVEEAASLDFTAFTFDIPTRDLKGWTEAFSRHALGMHIADRILRMSKPELVAFIKEGGEQDADVPGTMLAALDSAQKTFEGWGKLLDVARCRYLAAASSAVLADKGSLTDSVEPEPQQETPQAPVTLSASSLAETLDLASATMDELQAVHDVAERIGSVAYAHAWGPRCRRDENKHGASNFNAAGLLVQWIGDALTAVEAAAHKEARCRIPADGDDRETRLSLLAVTTIDNGDPDETEGFARELLAHAAAWREGR